MGVEECLQVEFQEVDIDDVEVVAALEFLFQKFNALLVDFDGSSTARSSRCSVSAPWPGPISSTASFAVAGRSPAISFAVGTSKKFCPNFRRRALSIRRKIEKESLLLNLVHETN